MAVVLCCIVSGGERNRRGQPSTLGAIGPGNNHIANLATWRCCTVRGPADLRWLLGLRESQDGKKGQDAARKEAAPRSLPRGKAAQFCGVAKRH